MVIVKNPKTGKYEVKPSPKSFYEAKKPSRSANGSRSSSGGGLTKEEIARAEKTSNISMSEQLRELERINKQLGIKPEQLARSASRRVSEEARRFVETETRMKVQPETQRLNGTQQQLQKQLESKRLAASQQLMKSLEIRQRIAKEAQERGKGYTRKELKKELEKQGTSIQELREATRAGREAVEKGKGNVFEEIRKKLEQEKLEVKPIVKVEKQKPIMAGEVQLVKTTFFGKLKDIPAKAIEKVTGKKPREVFRFITGSQEKDITKPLTAKEVALETSQVPVRALSIASTISERGTEAGFEKVFFDKEISFGTIPEKKITYLEPQFGTITKESMSGYVEKTVIAKERPVIITSRQAGKLVGGAISLGGTAVEPLLFAPGFIAGGTEKALNKELSTKARIYGGAEALLGTGIIGAKVYGVAKKAIGVSRFGEPSAKIVTVEPKYIRTTSKIETKIPETKIRIDEGKTTLKISQKRGGDIGLTKEIPSTTWIGKVSEFRKPGFLRKTKEFTGTVEIKEGTYLEKIKYPKGKEQIIRVEPSGEGTITLRKGEEIISTQKVKAKPSRFEFKNTISKVSEEKRFGKPVELKQESFKDYPFGREFKYGITEEFKTGLATRQKTGRLQIGKAEGVTQRIESSEDIFDITQIGAKTEIKSFKTPEVTKLSKRKIGQEIVYGEGKELPKSVVKFIKSSEQEGLLKSISPETNRFIGQEVRQKVTTSYGIKVPKVKTKPLANPIYSKETVEKAIAESGITGKLKKELLKPTKKAEVFTIPKPQKYLKAQEVKVPEIPIKLEVEAQKLKEKIIPVDVLKPTARKEEVKPLTIGISIETTKPMVTSISEKAAVQISSKVPILKPTTISGIKKIPKQREKEEQKQRQEEKQIQEPIQITKQLQIQRPQFNKEFIDIIKPEQPKPKTPEPIIKIPKPTSFPKRLLQKVKEEPGIFEAVGIRFGKEVTLAKGTKKEVVSKFEKFLSGTLGASGFLKVGGKKIKAKETGLLKRAEYRVSKVDPFKIVERKERRLKRGTRETQEIQLFKRKSKTKRKKK